MANPENRKRDDEAPDEYRDFLPITESGEIDWRELALRQDDSTYPETSSKFFSRILAESKAEESAQQAPDELASRDVPADPGTGNDAPDLTQPPEVL